MQNHSKPRLLLAAPAENVCQIISGHDIADKRNFRVTDNQAPEAAVREWFRYLRFTNGAHCDLIEAALWSRPERSNFTQSLHIDDWHHVDDTDVSTLAHLDSFPSFRRITFVAKESNCSKSASCQLGQFAKLSHQNRSSTFPGLEIMFFGHE
jgi:hypothetical protein